MSVRDLEILLDARAGTLAEVGEVLGRAGISIEGGDIFTIDGPVFASESSATS
ncbi:MAG: hypothetical protein JOZ77_08755 [Candidatus Eremiobacteraeota bacterium]|nr:hypothetical protein [Candidatus Eremiobacteraeota bacterium]